MNTCRHLIHKAGFAFLLLLVFVVGAGFFGHKIPGSFLPDEDQGYVYVGLQLPDASSLERTSEASKQVEQIILDTPGVEYVSSVVGYSMLSGVNTKYSSFFFVSFKNWDERKTPEESYDGIKRHLTGALSRVTSGIAFAFPPLRSRVWAHQAALHLFSKTVPAVRSTFWRRIRRSSWRRHASVPSLPAS